MTMNRITAHLAQTDGHDENRSETLVLMVATSTQTGTILPGTYYGELVENGEQYPMRYDVRSNKDVTGFYFGAYSIDEETHREEVYRTNLHDKDLFTDLYFSVVNVAEDQEYTYIIDNNFDTNKLGV